MIGRIMSMSLVHQKLYESKDLSRIDLGEYIEDLVGEIGKAYLEGRTDVGIVVNVESGIVSLIDVAIPCGLMLNELIVNAVKHGFPGDRGGSITVSMKRSAPGLLELSVADDGIGLPSGFDFRRDGKIGLQTVVSIVELQLHGKVYFDQGHGTVCRAIVRDNIFTRRV
jgi:two-component sensor histidine kinase